MLTNSPSIAETGRQGIAIGNMLQQSVGCGILAIDREDNLLVFTPEAERVLGIYSAREPMPAFHELPLPIQAAIREVRTSRRPMIEREIILASNGRMAHSISLTAMPVVESGDHNVSVIAAVKTFFTGNKIEQDLRRLDRLANVGTLSAGMAHEIKNALVAIRTFTDLLLEKHQDAELASVVRRELVRVDSMVSHMLKYSAPAQPEFSPVRLHDLLDHSLRLVQHRIKHKGVLFSREFHAMQDCISGDAHQLEQAIVNLMFNAVEAMNSNGTLTVSTDLFSEEVHGRLLMEAEPQASLRIRIKDTGTGISPEHMAHIFEPFFTTKPSGTGLGLAITRRIIEEHNGTIFAESFPGGGTTFVILLPMPETDDGLC